jgi:AcrR family transcriptional regulator
VARTVDPERHAARRLHIVDAALTAFARLGYDGATTAAICRQAGIGSGTFFHYFPTKAAVLLAILELGTQETREWFAAQAGREDAGEVVLDWVRHTADQAADPRMPGFVRAVGAVLSDPEVAAALAADEQAQRSGLRLWLRRARVAGEVRTDLSAATLASWVMLLLDGFLGRLANEDAFSARTQRATLVDTVERLLAPVGEER